MATMILGILIISAMLGIIYSNYFKKGRRGGCDCSSCDCPVKAQVDKRNH